MRICTAPSTTSTSPGVQPALLVLGRGQEGQERRPASPPSRLAGEPGRHVAEGVQVARGPARRRPAVPAGRDLDVQARWSARRRRSGRAAAGPAGCRSAAQLRRRRAAAAGSPRPSTRSRAPRSSSASTSAASSSRSTAISGRSSPVELLGGGAAARPRARRCRATRSRGPIRQRAPVSSRSSAAPSVGSASTRRVHDHVARPRGCPAGRRGRPPRPAARAPAAPPRSPAIWLRVRTSTAVVGRSPPGSCSGTRRQPRPRSARRPSIRSAIQAASSAYVVQQRTVAPCAAPARSATGERRGSSAPGRRRPAAARDSALATARISRPLRQLVVRRQVAAGAPPLGAGNSVREPVERAGAGPAPAVDGLAAGRRPR